MFKQSVLIGNNTTSSRNPYPNKEMLSTLKQMSGKKLLDFG